MTDKTIDWTLGLCAGLVALSLGGGIWYYAVGRKPHLLISAPIQVQDAAAARVQATGPNEVLLLVGAKASLYDFGLKKERWSVDLSTVPAVPAGTPPAEQAASLAVPQEKDPQTSARVKARFVALGKWAAALNEKRAALKTPVQIEAFNVEAAKYHDELVAARAEAGTVPAQGAGHPPAEVAVKSSEGPALVRIVSLASSVWIAQGRRITGLDRGDGHVLKALTFPGNISAVERGADEVFVLASAGQGRELQIARLTPGASAAQNLTVALPPPPREEVRRQGYPTRPSTPEHRLLFSAHGGSLLEFDVHLTEVKLTERETMSGRMGSDLEAADKKSTGGFGDDAVLMEEAITREAERAATGGKEIVDESTYEITLRRPFEPALPVPTVEVHGHAEVFATATVDLIVAGQELVAFDHSNRKLWREPLAQPLVAYDRTAGSDNEDSSPAHPFIEAADRIYFFDTAGLNAVARWNGKPAWNLPLEGIHKLQMDETGHLYVSSQPSGLGKPGLLLRVEAQTGRILWKVEKYEDCFVSGKDLYATHEAHTAETADSIFDSHPKAGPIHWKLYKLSPGDAKPEWEWLQDRHPSRVEADHQRVSLLFADELQVITSIAR